MGPDHPVESLHTGRLLMASTSLFSTFDVFAVPYVASLGFLCMYWYRTEETTNHPPMSRCQFHVIRVRVLVSLYIVGFVFWNKRHHLVLELIVARRASNIICNLVCFSRVGTRRLEASGEEAPASCHGAPAAIRSLERTSSRFVCLLLRAARWLLGARGAAPLQKVRRHRCKFLRWKERVNLNSCS